MPTHPIRYYGSGDVHFMTASCYQRKPVLATPERRDLFLTVLELMRRRYRFVVLGYVVMPEYEEMRADRLGIVWLAKFAALWALVVISGSLLICHVTG